MGFPSPRDAVVVGRFAAALARVVVVRFVVVFARAPGAAAFPAAFVPLLAALDDRPAATAFRAFFGAPLFAAGAVGLAARAGL